MRAGMCLLSHDGCTAAEGVVRSALGLIASQCQHRRRRRHRALLDCTDVSWHQTHVCTLGSDMCISASYVRLTSVDHDWTTRRVTVCCIVHFQPSSSVVMSAQPPPFENADKCRKCNTGFSLFTRKVRQDGQMRDRRNCNATSVADLHPSSFAVAPNLINSRCHLCFSLQHHCRQ
jgi:hypothetical protein